MKNPAAETLARITDALASGKTIYVSTALRHIKVTPKTAAQFAAANHPLFKASNKSLYMAVGRRYDCIDYCQITAQ